jgi:hypothetical protein
LRFFSSLINIGADLGAMADALGLLIGGPRLIYVIAFGSLCIVLQVFMTYIRYVAVLKWITLALFAYFGTVMVVEIPWPEAARGFLLPTLQPNRFAASITPTRVRRDITPQSLPGILAQTLEELIFHHIPPSHLWLYRRP